MDKPDLTEIPSEVVDYIEYLEGRGVPKLQLALAHVCDILADDIEMAISGGKDLVLLSSDDKTFQNFLAIVKNKKDFFELSLATFINQRKSVPVENIEEPEVFDGRKSNDNPFEAASKRVKAKINGAAR